MDEFCYAGACQGAISVRSTQTCFFGKKHKISKLYCHFRVLPLRVDDSQLFAFNNSLIAEQQQNQAQPVVCNSNVSQASSINQTNPVITVTAPTLGTITVPLNCNNTTVPVVSIGNSNDVMQFVNNNTERIQIKPEVDSIEVNNNQVKPSGKVGRPRGRRAQATRTRTPEPNTADADQNSQNETTPTTRRPYTRRSAKAFAAEAAEAISITEGSSATKKRKAEDPEKSPHQGAKRSRNSTPALPDPSPEKLRKSDGNTAPNGLSVDVCSANNISKSVSPQRPGVYCGNDLDSLLFDLVPEPAPHPTTATTVTPGTNGGISESNSNYVPIDKKPYAQLSELCPGMWIIFPVSFYANRRKWAEMSS